MKFDFFHASTNAGLWVFSYRVECPPKYFLAYSMQKWLSNLQLNFRLYIVKVKKSLENKMPVVKVVQMIQVTFPNFGLMANIWKISALKLKNVCFWPYSEKRFSDIDHETKIWNSNLDHLQQLLLMSFFPPMNFFSRLLLYIVQISFANMTAIFAQNQLIFVFWGIQPHMNWEITRHLHQHEKN